MTTPTVDINKRIEQYVKLRDEIKRREDIHKAELKPYKDTLEKLNSALLNHLNTIGGDSVSAEAGTVYKTAKRSASIADRDAFWNHVMGTQDFDLLDWKANVTAVTAYVDEKKSLPPGVNLSTTHVVGVRRK
jgi:hypothetical protein